MIKEDSISFELLYHSHADMVYNLCLNYLSNLDDAKELTQDVFVKVNNQLSDFNCKSMYKTWIYKITINTCLDAVKFKNRKKRFGYMTSLFNDSLQEKHELPKEFNHPGVLLEDKEAINSIFNQINKLKHRQKTVLLLKVMDELPIKDIADIMELGIKATESLLSRAKKNLKEKLQKNECI